jgi:putative transposase
MNVTTPGLYHIYNRGNNNQPIFFSEENYFYFLRKCQYYLKPQATMLCWCLMPTHFHFLIETTEQSTKPVKSGSIIMPALVNAFRLLQSSYAKGINQQLNRTGSLFQQKTKAKLITDIDDYGITVFHYIHQNPYAAGIVRNVEDWPYSSFPDFVGLRNGTLCDKETAIRILNINEQGLKTDVYREIDSGKIKTFID